MMASRLPNTPAARMAWAGATRSICRACWMRSSLRIASASAQQSRGMAASSAASERAMRTARAGSPASAASTRPNSSKRALSSTISATASAGSSPGGSSRPSRWMAWWAASRLPSVRSVISASTAGVACCFCAASRSVTHLPMAPASMRGVSTHSICLARASNQAVLVVARSRWALETSTRVPSSRRGSSSRSASPSSRVGLVFRRRSMSRWLAKSDVDWVASTSRPRSKRASTSSTSRSSKPSLRALARTRSAASMTSSSSSPLTQVSGGRPWLIAWRSCAGVLMRWPMGRALTLPAGWPPAATAADGPCRCSCPERAWLPRRPGR